MKFLLALLFCASSFAETLYVNQSGSGLADGSSLANAWSAAAFNTSGNWASGAGKISAGDTVILNGTISTPLVCKAGGTAGNPITIQWATGAKLSAAHWNQGGANNNAAFNGGFNYLVLDGGVDGSGLPQGIIEATANGTSLANLQFNHGVYFAGTCHDCVVKNLIVSNLFVRVSGSASTVEDNARGIRFDDTAGNNIVSNNIVVNQCHGIALNHANNSGVVTGDEIAWNIIEKRDGGILYTSTGNGVATNVFIHDNKIGSALEWDDSSDNFHHDGLHLYKGGTVTGHPDGLYYYNNYHYGDRGIHSTADVFLEDYWQHIYVFNNVFSNSVTTALHTPSNGHITLKGRSIDQNSWVVNNLINTVGAGGNGLYIDGATANTIENNVYIGDGTAISTPALVVNTSDLANTWNWNLYYNGTQFYYNNHVVDWATFKSQTSFDANTSTANPNLQSSGMPNSGSPVIDVGQSFSFRTRDYAGTSVPSGSAPDLGPYEFVQGGGGGGGSTGTPQLLPSTRLTGNSTLRP